MRYWLFKSEPDTFSIHDLKRVGREPWNGVRNYQARNFMMREMRDGDAVLFYHSNTAPAGVAGLAKVAGEPYPDATQWDPLSDYFDPKSPPDKPRWWLVDVQFAKVFPHFVTLDELRAEPELDGLLTLRTGNRLSITPVERKHYEKICGMGGRQCI